MARIDVLEDVYWRVVAERDSYVRSPIEVVPDGWRDATPPRGPWADALRRELHGARTLLDVGAGSRSWLGILRALGVTADYASVDPETRHVHEFADFLTVEGRYDAILMLELLEHLPLELGLRFLQHAVDHLTPGGVLVISTPNPGHPTSFQQSDFTHVRPWPAHDLAGLCRVAGLQVDVHRILHSASRVRTFARVWTSRALGVDPADHLVLFARSTK